MILSQKFLNALMNMKLEEDINDFNKISETIKDDIKKYRQQSRDI